MDIEIFEETQPGSCTSEFFEVHASSVTCGISYLVSTHMPKKCLTRCTWALVYLLHMTDTDHMSFLFQIQIFFFRFFFFASNEKEA